MWWGDTGLSIQLLAANYRHSPKPLSGQPFGSHYLYPRSARWDRAQVGTEHHLQVTVCWLGTRYRGKELAATGR